MKKITLTGNLTKEPELTETSSKVKLCRFSLAVNYKKANGEAKVDYYNIIAWRGLGENVAKYCHKGSKVLVVGDIELNPYKDKNNVSRLSIDVTAQDIEFLASGSQDGKKSYANTFDDDDIPY